MTFTVRELDYDGAAEVLDLDCSHPLAPGDLAALNTTFLRYPILAIRNQQLTPQQQVTFSQQFGEIELTGNTRYYHPDEPRVLVLSNELDEQGRPVGIADAGVFLHSDL